MTFHIVRPPQLRNIAEMTIEEAWSMPERLAVHRANVHGDFVLPDLWLWKNV